MYISFDMFTMSIQFLSIWNGLHMSILHRNTDESHLVYTGPRGFEKKTTLLYLMYTNGYPQLQKKTNEFHCKPFLCIYLSILID